MAQRAYRHRKETTISSLEKQVQELRGANEEMSNIFLNLHDFARQRGILDRERDFSNHLKSSTERFLALAKSIAADDSAREDDTNSADGRKKTQSPDPEPSRRNHQVKPTATQIESSLSMEPHPSAMWGYQMAKDNDADDQRIQGLSQLDELNTQTFMNLPRQQGHQIISRATPDNASFSFDIDTDFLQNFRAEVPDIFETYQKVVTFQESLPLPKTLSHSEATFGRHLQRASMERGWRLITDKDPDPIRFQEVFGFCLHFESRDQIEMRLRNALDATTTSKDALFDWKQPFVHLGGSGTYYPLDEDISGSLMPKFRTGMSMGPFSPAVLETREHAMLDEFRMNMPGFDGPWFDSSEVDNYLRSCGINIPPNVEFITIDLDSIKLRDSSSPISLSDSSFSNTYSPKTPTTPELRFTQLLDNDVSAQDTYVTGIDTNRISQGSDELSYPAPFGDWSGIIPENPEKTHPNISFDLTGPIFNSTDESQLETMSLDIPFREERHATLSVTVLVEGELEIYSHKFYIMLTIA
jgi:hypothetical protein